MTASEKSMKKMRRHALAKAAAIAVVSLRLLACSSERPRISDQPPPNVAPNDTDTPDESTDGGETDGHDARAIDAEELGCPPPDAGPGPTPPEGLCLPATAWTEPTALPFSLGAELLVSITPDERSIAVHRVSGPSGELYVFDREDDEADTFAEGKRIEPDVPVRTSRAALSPDGLRLVLLADDWHSFVVMERPSRTDSFVPSDESSPARSAFAKLNAAGASLDPAEAFDDPVFGADGKSFLYSVIPDEGHTLRISTKDMAGVWEVGTPLDDCELQSLGEGLSRRPTGLSADGRTLFYFDEARGIARAAFRGAASGVFTSFVDLGARISPQPSADCTRLYSSRIDGGASDVIRESR